MRIDTKTDPDMQAKLNDARDNLDRIVMLRKALTEGTDTPVVDGAQDLDAKERELKLNIEGFESNLEIIIRKGMMIEFIESQDIQCALNVRRTSDYLLSHWMAQDIYRELDDARAMYPRITDEQWKAAKRYTLKQDAKLGFEHLKSLKRMALVTDVSWMHHAMHLFGWAVPGELKVFPEAELEAAIEWAAGDAD